MKTAKLGLLVLSIFCVPALWVLAAGDDAKVLPGQKRDDVRANSDRPRKDDPPRSDDPTSDDSPKDDNAIPTPSLGKTITLTFTIISEDEEPSFVVSSASGDFLITHDESSLDFEHSLTLTGHLRLVDDEDRVFITYDATTHHNDLNEGYVGDFTCEGSAIVQFGKKTTLAHLGEEPLTLTATVEE